MVARALARQQDLTTPQLDEGAMDRRILVVEDSELYCQQLSQILAGPGREITLAHDGTTALELLVERPYSLVITDLALPGVTGIDLIREIRSRDLPVTIIVISGPGSLSSRPEAGPFRLPRADRRPGAAAVLRELAAARRQLRG